MTVYHHTKGENSPPWCELKEYFPSASTSKAFNFGSAKTVKMHFGFNLFFFPFVSSFVLFFFFVFCFHSCRLCEFTLPCIHCHRGPQPVMCCVQLPGVGASRGDENCAPPTSSRPDILDPHPAYPPPICCFSLS